MQALKYLVKMGWKAIITLLPSGWKKQLITVLCEWAVKSTKTKLDDKLWAKVKETI
jgi:hypothetical protein|tara:strand:- start:1045 stop:1212 length:168 start_codon:yes stop_codon:yes gene_type:complete